VSRFIRGLRIGGCGRLFRPGQPRPNIDTLDVGKGVADLLVSDLIDGGIRLLEREHLADVAREHEGGDAPRARYVLAKLGL